MIKKLGVTAMKYTGIDCSKRYAVTRIIGLTGNYVAEERSKYAFHKRVSGLD